MKHAREDYNRFQDPLNKIPEDEPVMLFRAQDKYAIAALEGYVEAIFDDADATDEANKIMDIVDEFIAEFKNWGTKKSPDIN